MSHGRRSQAPQLVSMDMTKSTGRAQREVMLYPGAAESSEVQNLCDDSVKSGDVELQSPSGGASGNSMTVEQSLVVMQGPYLLHLFTAQQILGRVRKQLCHQQSLWWTSNRTKVGLIPHHPLLLPVGRLPPHRRLMGWMVVCVAVFCRASLCQSLMAQTVGIAHRQDLALGPGLGLPHPVHMGPREQQMDIRGLGREWVGLKALIRGLLMWIAYPMGGISKEKLALYN